MNGSPPPLAYVAKMFPRLSETFILNELLELERLGFDITIYSLKHRAPGPTHPQLAHLCARIVYLPERPIHWLTRGLLDACRAFAVNPSVTLRTLLYVMTRGTHQAWKRFFQASTMAADLRLRPVRHIHAHFASAPSRVAWFASRLAGVPFSFTAHAKDIYQHGTDYDLLRDKIAAASFVVTVSDYNRDHLTRIAGEGSRIRRLYNGVDLERFTPHPISNGALTVLTVGRMVQKKGFDVLLRAWPDVLAGCPGARLVVVGTGPEDTRLRSIAQKLEVGDSILWRGACTQEELRDELAAAHVFCLPCRVAEDGNRDGLPTVLLEALATGLPCVTTTIAGVPEIVRDRCEGNLVPPEDTNALADALIALLRDPERRATLGVCARHRAEALFDLTRNVGQLAAWFQESA